MKNHRQLAGHRSTSLRVDIDRWLNQGLQLQQRRDFRQAERCYQAVLQRVPDHPDALHLIGTLAIEAGETRLAIDYMHRATKTKPRDPYIQHNLGNALVRDHDLEAAISHLRTALELKPDLIDAMCNLGRAYRLMSKAEGGLPYLERAYKLNPKHPLSCVTLAESLLDLGRLSEAEQYFREAIQHQVSLPRALHGMSAVKKHSGESAEFALIVAQLGRKDLVDEQRTLLHHAAGKILNDMRRYDEAFHHFRQAKEISGHRFNILQYQRAISDLIGMFDPIFLASRRDFGDPTELPVFIVGMPRSGTTLTEQIAASHPHVYGAGELHHLRNIAKDLGFDYRDLSKFRRSIHEMTPKVAKDLAAEYLKHLRRHSGTALRITDKMPHNFELIGLIRLLFPNAKIVHCSRDPIDTCVSCFMNNFSEFHGYNADLTNLGLYYREYHRLMQYWAKLGSTRIHESVYESLTSDQEAQSRLLIDHLGLDWNDACLRFFEADRTVTTISRWQVRQPIYQTSHKRWKNYGDQLEPLLRSLGDLHGQ